MRRGLTRCTQPAAARRAHRWAVLCLAVALVADPAPAQVLHLTTPSAWPAAARLGDTLAVGLHVSAAARRLTSAGWALQYDPAVLRPVDAPPFRTDPIHFPRAVVYENDVVSTDVVDARRARYVAVAGNAVAGERPVLTGEGTAATVRFVVVGLADSASVQLVTEGADRPRFTELERPGIEAGFTVGEPRRLQAPLESAGFLPLEDVTLEAGERVGVPLRGRTAVPATWSVEAGPLLQAHVFADTLWLRAASRSVGSTSVDYRIHDATDAALGAGTLAVTVTAAAPWLVDPSPAALEDGGEVRIPLDRFLVEGAALAGTARWEVTATTPLTATIQADDLLLRAPRDWWGAGRYGLRVTDETGRSDTLAAVLAVAAVNDAPQWVPPADTLRALTGVRVTGPLWRPWVQDVDDDPEGLRLDIEGQGVDAWEEAGRLHLRGVMAGPASVRLVVSDAAGATAATTIPVRVEQAGAQPVLLFGQDLALPAGERRTWAIDEIVADADTPPQDLRVEVSADGPLTALVRQDSLILQGQAVGQALLHLGVVDPERNATAGSWRVSVVAEATASPPVDPDPVDDGGSPADPDPATIPDEDVDLRFTTLPVLTLSPGDVAEIDLAAYVEPAGEARLFTTTAGAHTTAQVDGAGRLRVEAIHDGQEVLLLTAVGTQGRTTTVPLDVRVRTADPVSPLRLGALPSVRLDSHGETQIDLDGFASGAVGEIAWSVAAAERLVSAEVAGRLLTLRAGADGGRATVLVAARDEAGRQASEVLPIDVRGRAADADGSVRLQAPADGGLLAGEMLAVDLARLTQDPGSMAWQVDAEDLQVAVAGDSLVLRAADGAVAGWRDVALTARRGESALTVHFRVAVTPPPGLVLAPAPTAVAAAGRRTSLFDLGALVEVGAADEVVWSVDGGLRLLPSLEGDHLVVDGTEALPGREVLRLQARLGVDTRRLSLPVLVRPPDVRLVGADTLRLGEGSTSVSLDDRVRGEIPAAELHWAVRATPAGVEAHWDAAARRLHVEGDGRGSIRLEAHLASGLAVHHLTVPVLPTVGSVADEGSPGDWSLALPPWPDVLPGDTVRVSLGDIALGIDADRLTWSVHADGGSARLVDDSLLLWGEEDFHVTLSAVGGNRQRRIDLSVAVAEAPGPTDPPTVDLDWRVDDGGLLVRLEARPETARRSLHWRMDGVGEAVPLDGATGWVPLSTAGTVELVGVAEAGSLRATATTRLSVAHLRPGDALASPDGHLRVEVPAGASSVDVVLSEVDADGSVRLVRGIAVPLTVVFPGAAGGGVEQRRGENWASLTAVFAGSPGVGALLAPAAGEVALRPAGDAEPDSVRGPFPNPFNASVTLPLGPGPVGHLTIFDAVGRPVRRYAVRGAAALWDGRDEAGRPAASGVYLYELRRPGAAPRVGKVTLVR